MSSTVFRTARIQTSFVVPALMNVKLREMRREFGLYTAFLFHLPTERGFGTFRLPKRLSRFEHKVQLTDAWYSCDATLLSSVLGQSWSVSSNPCLFPAYDRILNQARKYHDKEPPVVSLIACYRQTVIAIACLQYVWLYRSILYSIVHKYYFQTTNILYFTLTFKVSVFDIILLITLC